MTQPMLILTDKRPEFSSKNQRYNISMLKIAAARLLIRTETLAHRAASHTERSRSMNLMELMLQGMIDEGPEPVWKMMCEKHGDPTQYHLWGIRPHWYKED